MLSAETIELQLKSEYHFKIYNEYFCGILQSVECIGEVATISHLYPDSYGTSIERINASVGG